MMNALEIINARELTPLPYSCFTRLESARLEYGSHIQELDRLGSDERRGIDNRSIITIYNRHIVL